MTTALQLLLLTIVLLGPFALAARAYRHRQLPWNLDQFRFTTTMLARLLEDRDADSRRIDHDLDAIRTRFEQHPTWPTSGARGDSR